NARKQRFSIKWSASWKRVNYDLHNVLGFYAMLVGLALALTGMVMGFQWFADTVYTLTGGKGSAVYQMPLSDTTAVVVDELPKPVIDQVWEKLEADKPATGQAYISVPQLKTESFYTYINHKPSSFHQVDYFHFDQFTGKKLGADMPFDGKYEDADFAKKLQRMNYDIHIGAILGLPGKLIVFFASLIIASLPVTGTVIWWGRRKKTSKKKKGRKVLAIQ
ncbi:PepSY-associated TM helix domain-containing protein, partial [Limibacter armeniacum]